MNKFSEYVTLGHPDKIADYISEYILDYIIKQDENVRYALEVQVKDNHVSIAGELTTNVKEIDYLQLTKEAVEDIGYTKEYAERWGEDNTINPDKIVVDTYISKQSNDIAQGVDNEGWGDQGIMYGMAVNNEKTDYLPYDYYYAKLLSTTLFKSGLGGLDIKTQIVYDEVHKSIDKVIVAIPMLEDTTKQVKKLIKATLPINKNTIIIINGTGKYVKHSSMGDCGTTGRKLAVDFYGGNCNVGGGSPWTKDGSKADLTLNLYARKLAVDFIKSDKNLKEVKYCLGCCIGKKEINIVCITGNNESYNYEAVVTPNDLIKMFNLNKPIYSKLCKNGLFSEIK